MNGKPDERLAEGHDKPLLSSFLRELNIARRKLALYPPEHPQVRDSTAKTLERLSELFRSSQAITLGIAPETLYFEQLWLDKDDADNRDFAKFFSALGIASVSFRSGLAADELIRFNQLLRSDRLTIENYGGFSQLLDQQRIEHITVVAVNYDAFLANENLTGQQPEKGRLWENFLDGLRTGTLDFGDSDDPQDLSAVAEILNQQFADAPLDEPTDWTRAIGQYISVNLAKTPETDRPGKNDENLNRLLQQLNPAALQGFFKTALQVMDRQQDQAPRVLRKIPPSILQRAIADKNRQKLQISTRLFELVNKLAASDGGSRHSVQATAEPMTEDMVRARLDVLFSEERQDLYMPGSYQAALRSILNDETRGSIPEEEKLKLKVQIEDHSVEKQCTDIIFEMLEDDLSTAQESAVQQNLVELSRFFLDTGDFSVLRDIYQHWSQHLSSNRSGAGIFDEKVLANHNQPTFMTEVLDAFEIWEEDRHPQITGYIATVGEAYSEAVIERLGLAPSFAERKLWMRVLEAIGGDAQQKIIASLNDKRWYLVRNLLTVLGRGLNQNSIRAIHKFCAHPHHLVRREAIRCLFTCNPATANRQLLHELYSDDLESKAAALEIAYLSRDGEVLALLHRLLEGDITSDDELDLKKSAVHALVRIGNRESLPILRRILLKKGLLASRRAKLLQADIIEKLAVFPGTSAEKLLGELSEGRHRQLARKVLAQRQEGTA